ncbi:MAG: hypothetical protein ACMUHY_08355 [Thermoplasmatota archaeon]
MFDDKGSRDRKKANLKEAADDLEEDIDMLATEELWKELKELEEMLEAAS